MKGFEDVQFRPLQNGKEAKTKKLTLKILKQRSGKRDIALDYEFSAAVSCFREL